MEQHIIDKVRSLITQIAPEATERTMYGGFVFELPGTKPKRLFAGLFKRKGYVTLELDKGADLDDPLGVLEGTGKDRRHIKLEEMGEIETKAVKAYLIQSLNQSR